MACVWHFFICVYGCGWDGMGFGWCFGWKRKKSALPKRTAAIESIEEIEAIERIALRGCGEGRVCLWYAIPRWRFFCDYVGVAKWWWMGDFLEEC